MSGKEQEIRSLGFGEIGLGKESTILQVGGEKVNVCCLIYKTSLEIRLVE